MDFVLIIGILLVIVVAAAVYFMSKKRKGSDMPKPKQPMQGPPSSPNIPR